MALHNLRSSASAAVQRWSPDLGAGTEPSAATAARERRIVAFGVGLTLLAVIGQTAAHLLNVVLFDREVHLLDVDAERTLFSWASASTIFAAAAFAALLAALRPERARPLLGLSAVLAFLSVDDALGIHERVSNRIGDWLPSVGELNRVIWPLVYLPLLAYVFVVLVVLAHGLRPTPARLVRVGLALLVAAVVLEMASQLLFASGLDRGDLGYEVEAALEEGAELAGWMLLTVGLAVGVTAAAADRSTQPSVDEA
jgi:hypothetical protein